MDIQSSLPFSKSFDFASGAIGNRFQNPFWRLTEAVFGKSLRNAVAEVKNFGKLLVSSAAAKRSCMNPKGLGKQNSSVELLRSNLIESLLDQIDEQDVVADSVMNYLSAGISLIHPIQAFIFLTRY